MNLKAFVLPMIAGAAATVAVSIPSQAAMPAGKVGASADDGLVIQVAKRKKKGETRQQELDRSINDGTVPSRYRANVPREYQQYVPFERR